MANTQATFGFKHVGDLTGAAPTYQQSVYFIQKTNGTPIGFGDVVIRNSSTSPYIVQATSNAASTNPIVGIFVGCEFATSPNGLYQYSPSWTGVTPTADVKAYVIDAPNAVFLAATLQTSLGTGDIGKTIGIAYPTAGSAPSTTGGQYSVATLDQSTLNNSGGTAISGLPFRIVGLYGTAPYGGVGNGTDPTTNYNWALVTFNSQVNKALVGF